MSRSTNRLLATLVPFSYRARERTDTDNRLEATSKERTQGSSLRDSVANNPGSWNPWTYSPDRPSWSNFQRIMVATVVSLCLCLSSSKKKRETERGDRDMTPMPRYETTHLLCSFWSRLLASVVSCLPSLLSLVRARDRRQRKQPITYLIPHFPSRAELRGRGKWRQAVSVLSPFYLSTACPIFPSRARTGGHKKRGLRTKGMS